MQKENVIAPFDLRNFFKRWPWFYYSVGTIFGPMFYCGLSAKKFLERYPRKGKILNIGSGPRILGATVTNVDIYRYAGVAIVADANAIPLPDGSVSAIISDNVLEHIAIPSLAVKEIHRLLESGGLAYVAVPFIYPFHSSPLDYQRWTKKGLIHLFHEFEMVEIGVRAGPFSALTAYINHLIAFIFSFGSPTLASFIVNLVMLVTFPIKLPDILFNHWPKAEEVAAVFYCVVRKK